MTGLKTNWLEQAAQCQAAQVQAAQSQSNKSNLSNWLQNKRQLAAEYMQTLQAPSRKLESWRYADVSRLSKELNAKEFNAKESIAKELTAKQLDSVDLSNDAKPAPAKDNGIVEIILNESGMIVNDPSPGWLEVQSWQDSAESDWKEVSFDQETVVNLANTVLVQSGGVIKINSKVNGNNEPVNIKLIYAFDDTESWQYVRNQLIVDADTQVNWVEVHQSGRINVVNIYDLAANVVFNRTQEFRLNAVEQMVSFNQFEMADKVNVVNMNHHIGGSLQHHVHWVNFNAQDANYKSGSINKSFDNNNITDIVNVNHNHKNNLSDVTHRSIAKDQSQIYNNAKALVAVGADGSEIEQDLKNILLSPDAKIFSKPELEVYADEVIAAHGSTIGALDETALFYLQSRGVDIEQAREIMIESFEQEAHVL